MELLLLLEAIERRLRPTTFEARLGWKTIDLKSFIMC